MSKFSRPDRSHFFPYRRGETYPQQMTMNFRKLNVDACRKYLRHYHINTRPDCSANEFRVAVARHFDQTLEVDEAETIRNFCKHLSQKEPDARSKTRSTRRPSKRQTGRKQKLDEEEEDSMTVKKRRRVEKGGKSVAKRSNSEEEDKEEEPEEVYCICRGRSYGKMIACENPDCRMKWFHFACVNLTPSTKPTGKWFCPECAKNRSSKRASRVVTNEQKTYKNMIENALQKLAKKKKGRAEGTFREICSMIEKHHWRSLNWKSESDIRKTPIWRSSVRKILLSNELFSRTEFNPNVFCFSSDGN